MPGKDENVLRSWVFLGGQAASGIALTGSWRLSGQAATSAAGAMAGLLGDNPRPVFSAAEGLTLLTVVVAWLAGLRKEDASSVAVSLLAE